MPQFADRVKVTSTSTGTGAITLSSTAVSGYQAFPSSLDGETVGYVIESGSAWEIGTGTYTHSSLNLTRSLRSSSTGSLLSLASGTHTVFLTPAFQDIQIVEAFSSTSDLPSASDNHGRIYHVHGEGALYFAHSGSWVKVANYSDITTYSNATTSAAGLMSAADKTKLDGVEASADVTDTTNVVAALTAGNNITIAADGTISSTASGGITVQDEGSALTTTATTLNFAGAGVQATGTGATKTITISGSSISGTLTDPVKQTEFTGSATTTFTVGYTVGSISVFLNGAKLAASDFTATNGTSVVLGSACAASDIVTVVEYGTPFASPYSSTVFTVGTSSEYNTSTKVLTTNYTANKVAIYLNGVKLLSGTDYTASNGTTIDLTNSSPTTGDKIEVVEHGALADSGTLIGLTDTPSSLGTAGQILQVNSGATALEFADASGSGVTVYTGLSGTDGTPSGATYLLNASSPSAGDLAYVSANTSLYQNNGNGWYRIAVINTTPTISSVADASSNTTPFTLTGGTNTVITVTASDADEGTDLVYSYSVTSGSLNGTTVTQGTGASENVFTITPHASNATTFSLTFTVSDNINAATSVAAFSLSFISYANATQQAKIQASDANGTWFGEALSISSDGNTAIVGAKYDSTTDTHNGAAYILTRSGTTWSQQAKLKASDPQAYDNFGCSVAISDDGNTVIMGALQEDTTASDAGAAYIFTRSGTTWSQQAKIQASDAQAGDSFGRAVAISDDGDTAIVGANTEDTNGSNAGSVYVFTRSGTSWGQQAKLQASDAEASDQFGMSLSLSDDGNTAIISSFAEDTTATDAGSAYIFTRSGTTWSQQAKLQASDAESSDYFGYSVSIDSDGNTAVISSRYEDTTATNAGSAYIFTRSGTTWSQQAKLQASDADANDYFGNSVAISGDGDIAIIGCLYDDTTATDSGAAYVFTRSGTTWSQQAKLKASDPESSDMFGSAVTISSDGDTVIVGAHLEDTTATNSGSVYVFVPG